MTRRADPTRCPKGHDLTVEANRFTTETGTVGCRECRRISVRLCRQRRRERFGRSRSIACKRVSGPRVSVEAIIDEAVAMESATPWERAEYFRRRAEMQQTIERGVFDYREDATEPRQARKAVPQ